MNLFGWYRLCSNFYDQIRGCVLGLRVHATQHEGTRPPIKFNALFTIKNKKERFVNAEKAYLRIRDAGWG